jgi:hypothetical protein
MYRFITLLLLLFPFLVSAQTNTGVTVSGAIKDVKKIAIPYVNVAFKAAKDSAFVTGTVTNAEGRFSLAGVKSGNYIVEISMVGFKTKRQPFTVGTLSSFLDLGVVELEEDAKVLNEVNVVAGQPV